MNFLITIFSVLFFVCFTAVTQAIVESNSYSVKGKTTRVRREQYLDHLDSDTLAYYLDEYPGHDVAIMFYATWDQYSHTLAPYWARKFLDSLILNWYCLTPSHLPYIVTPIFFFMFVTRFRRKDESRQYQVQSDNGFV
jgi:hypothetical protein